MAREGGDRAPLARCWASSSAPIPVHFQSKLVDGRRKSLAALEAASSADQASSLGGYNPSQFALFGTLPRSITSPRGGDHCVAPHQLSPLPQSLPGTLGLSVPSPGGTRSGSALGRGCSSSPSPARCRDQLVITPAVPLPHRRRGAYLLHTIALQPAVP